MMVFASTHSRGALASPRASLTHRVALSVVLLVTLSALGAPAARAQQPVADSLAAILSTSDVHLRAEVVGRLNALPIDELTPTARAALIALLDAEANGSVAADPRPLVAEDETYDEYIIDLTDAVLKLHDPASLRALTLLGIQTGQDAQQWVASFGASSLPALAEAWTAKPEARPTIVNTWAFELALTGANALPVKDRQRVLGDLMAATDEFPIAVAAAARIASLSVLAPTLATVAESTSSDVVRNRAEKAVELLGPVRGATSPLTLLNQTLELARGFCVRPGEGNDARANSHPNRPSTCGKIRSDLNKARAALDTNRPEAARGALSDAASTAASARAAGVISANEAAAVEGNVSYLLTRI